MINNTYPESIKESGNYLRMSLKNISEQHLPYNPISYLLWYEHATGRNDLLIKDIDLFLEKKEPITIDTVEKLIRKHLIDNKSLLTEKKVKELQRILVEMTQYLSKSGSQIDLQSDTLESCAKQLPHATSLTAITRITQQIVLETKSIAKSSKMLKGKLDSAVSEISVLGKELKEAKLLARTDMLTSLLNRRGFDSAILQVLDATKITPNPFSIIMLDIDHFKKVNDTYGHLIGDNVLKMLSELLKKNIRKKDIAARFGGEEFILALPQTSLDVAYELAEKIRLSLEKINWKIKNTGKSMGQITISTGIALYKIGESLDTVIKRADEAMYHAKNTGRNKTKTESNLM